MARQENPFALLSDDEGDDVSALLARAAAMVEVQPPPPEENKKKGQLKSDSVKHVQYSESVRDEAGRGRGGGRGRGRALRRSGSDGNEVEQFSYGGVDGNQRKYGRGNVYQRNYGGDSSGNVSENNWQGRERGRGTGRGRGRGRGRGLSGNQMPVNEDQVPVSKQHVENKGQDVGGDGGWEQVNESQVRGYGSTGKSMKDGERIWGYRGERRGFGGSGNRGYRAREGRPFGCHDGRNYADGEMLNDSETKEVSHTEVAVSVVTNSSDTEWNVPVQTDLPKDMEPEKEKSEDVVNQDNSEIKTPEEEGKEMTLEEYERLLLEKRKALESLKTEQRKVTLDKDFETMQLVEKKKGDSLFVKLKSEKDKLRKKDSFDKEEKVRKSVSINEFLKPSEGVNYMRSVSGRGRGVRGRGRGERGGYLGRAALAEVAPALHIEDPGQFPVLRGAVKA